MIWAEMREQQEIRATGHKKRDGKEERGFFSWKKKRRSLFFKISGREIISMPAGIGSNEEPFMLAL